MWHNKDELGSFLLNMKVRLHFTYHLQCLLDIYITSKISEEKILPLATLLKSVRITAMLHMVQWNKRFSTWRNCPISGQSYPQQRVLCWWYKCGYLLESRHAAGKEIISAHLPVSPFHLFSIVLASWETQCSQHLLSQPFPSWTHLVREQADGWPWLPVLHTGSPESIKVVKRGYVPSLPHSFSHSRLTFVHFGRTMGHSLPKHSSCNYSLYIYLCV